MPPAPQLRTFVAFHLAEPTGPSRSLEGPLRWLAAGGELELAVPEIGRLMQELKPLGRVTELPYRALVAPRGLRVATAAAQLTREVGVFRRALRRARAQLAVAVTTTLPALLVAARLEHVPAIAYVGELLDAGEPRGRAIAGATLLAGTARLASAMLCCSDAVAGQFPLRYAQRMITSYPPIASGYDGGDGDAFRVAHDLVHADPLIASVGNISHGRGQDVLLCALPAIRRVLPNAACAIVGDAHARDIDIAYRARLDRLVTDLGIAHAVRFTGFDERVANIYAAANVIVNPARIGESFGRVACEAIVAGCPVVSTRVGAVPDVLRDGIDALLFEPGDPAALAQAVLILHSDPELAAGLVAAGRASVLRYTDECAIRDFSQAVDVAIAANGPA